MNASQELERGQLAKEVLENAVFRDALDSIEQEIYRQWQAEKQASEREWLWALMQAHKRLQAVLTDTMQTGSLRSKSIEMQQSKLARIGRTLTGR